MAVNWQRWFRHLFTTRRAVGSAFPLTTLEAIERAVATSELAHAGEIRVAIEGALEPSAVWAGKTPRQRALEVFAALGVWDTAANNGILIYVLYADRDVEIVADRGFNGRVSAEEWSAVCDVMDAQFRAGHYEAGAVQGVLQAGELLARHFPPLPGGRDEDELPNRPAVF